MRTVLAHGRFLRVSIVSRRLLLAASAQFSWPLQQLPGGAVADGPLELQQDVRPRACGGAGNGGRG
jgi:hypothetical protein